MEEKMMFPKNFWWGAATSGPQTEGSFDKNHDSIMDHWYKENTLDFFNEVGPDIASDFYHHYKEDIHLLKKIGMNSFRTSIQWSRFIKDFETGEVDERAVAFYQNIIDECKQQQIELVLNLHHFDMPYELFEKYGGWESKHVVNLFALYAEKVFEHFGDQVRYWTTFNEPMVIPEAGYLYGFHYPKYVGKGKEAVQVIYNIALASALCIKVYRDHGYCGKIGNILNLTPAYPRSNSAQDLEAAEFADNFFNRIFLDPALKGEFPEAIVDVLSKDQVLWESNEEELAIIKVNTIDFLGVNYYHPKRVKAREIAFNENKPWMPDRYFEEYDMPNKRVNPYKDWEIYPKAVYDIAINIKSNYHNIPWFISENGMGVAKEERFRDDTGFIDDQYRIDFYEEHLTYLHNAIQEGCNCFGYHAWTAFDCWSWNNAYKNRYGFIAVDLATQKRTIKASGYWLQKVSASNSCKSKSVE